jgi:hypothetical protein
MTVEESEFDESTGTSRSWQLARNPGKGEIPLVMTKTGTGRLAMVSSRSCRSSSSRVRRYSVSLSPMICTRPGLM